MRKWLTTITLASLVSVVAPAQASADWLFTPFIGFNWGGAASFGDFGDFDDEFEQRANFGASLTYMGAGAIGFEVDFGWSPNFFENTRGGGDFEFGDNNVTTVMANLTLGAPVGGQHGGGIRPYASGGAGIIKVRAQHARDVFDVASTDWGFNLGGGIMGFFSDNVGMRGDVRYFRSLQDSNSDGDVDFALSSFHFWRATVGLTVRF